MFATAPGSSYDSADPLIYKFNKGISSIKVRDPPRFFY